MAKRFTKTAINWVDFEKRVLPEQKPKYMSFRAHYDMYLRRMESHPAEPKKLNWEHYKKLVPTPGVIDKLKSTYEAFKVPYPKDTLTPKIEEQWKAMEGEIKAYCADIQKDVEAAEKELANIKSLPKFSEMTMEVFYDMYPDEALDSVKRPTFWPHTPEEQEGYKPKIVKVAKKK